MYESNLIEQDLRKEAIKISEKLEEAPVVIIVGGTGDVIKGKGALGSCMLGSSLPQTARFRELVGIIQTAIQIITFKHFHHQFHTVKIVESKD